MKRYWPHVGRVRVAGHRWLVIDKAVHEFLSLQDASSEIAQFPELRAEALTLTAAQTERATFPKSRAESLVVADSSSASIGSAATLTGLDWDGTAPGRRMLYWSSPPAAYSMTYLFKVYQRNQVTNRADTSRYYTTFFHGNNGAFVWGGSYANSYYGCHPYPIPEDAGDGKWEISVDAGDLTTRDDGSAPYVVNNQWYSQAVIATNMGGSNRRIKFYIALPSVATVNTLTYNSSNGYTTPPTPAIMIGQAPDNGSGQSWGGYSGWEEQNAIIRGIQIYASALTEAQVLALSALDTDAAVLAYCATQSLTPWYLNMNPTPTDVTDKSGSAHHGSWAGTFRPALYTTGAPPIDALTISTEQATPEQIALYLTTTRTVGAGSVTVRYRTTAGPGAWQTGHPLLRISTTGNEAGPPAPIVDSFAGTIFDLTPGTTYDVELTHVESGQPNKTTEIQRTTRSLPATSGTANRTANSVATIGTQFAAVNPGDVLEIAAGTYDVSSLTLSRSGTAASPIYIRGASRTGTILRDTTGTVLTIAASHVVFERLSIVGSSVDSGTNASSTGIVISGARTNVTVRDVTMTGVDRGVIGSAEQTGALVYNCSFTGNNLWNSTYIDSNITWNDTGVELPGFGNCIFNNTLTAFGDTIAFASTQGDGYQSEGNYCYRNRINKSCDDTIEFDYCQRNIGMYDNKITNCAAAMSVSPAFAGPFYYFRNIIVNTARGPYKWNGQDVGSTGILVYNNTIVRVDGESAVQGYGWIQFQDQGIGNWSYRNNILIYRSTPTGVLWFGLTGLNPMDMDYNAWFPNSSVTWSSGADYSTMTLAIAGAGQTATTPLFGTSTRRHEHDKVTTTNPFVQTITLGSNHLTEYTADPDLTLAGGSAPKNAGIAIPGITDGFSGAAPDMGAIIAGRAAVTYGDPSNPAVPSWVNALPLGQWYEVPNTRLSNATGYESGIWAYSTCAPNITDVIYWGGGHDDPASNAVFCQRLGVETPFVERLRVGSVGSPRCSAYYSDGRPTARHTYQTLACPVGRNGLMSFTANSVDCSDGSQHFDTVDRFDFNALDWDSAGTWTCPSGTSGSSISSWPMCSAQDGTGNFFVLTNNNLRRWNNGPAPASWTTLNSGGAPTNTDTTCAHDPINNRIVVFGGGVGYYNASTGARTTFSFTGANASAASGGTSTWAWCPDAGMFYGMNWSSGTTVYQCTQSFVVTTKALTGPTPPGPGDGGYGELNSRFFYLPGLRLMCYAPGPQVFGQNPPNLWVFRTG